MHTRGVPWRGCATFNPSAWMRGVDRRRYNRPTAAMVAGILMSSEEGRPLSTVTPFLWLVGQMAFPKVRRDGDNQTIQNKESRSMQEIEQSERHKTWVMNVMIFIQDHGSLSKYHHENMQLIGCPYEKGRTLCFIAPGVSFNNIASTNTVRWNPETEVPPREPDKAPSRSVHGNNGPCRNEAFHVRLNIPDDADKPQTSEDYDKFVSAEIPDPVNEELYQTVVSCMMQSTQARCCLYEGWYLLKIYPRPFCEETLRGNDLSTVSPTKRWARCHGEGSSLDSRHVVLTTHGCLTNTTATLT
ncbi:hypothetical protein Btru_072805 [Bulinus truncatus]|nr:hypothetical protein Btru_072805 [Bulinus truncatus]